MEHSLIAEYTPLAKKVGRSMAAACHLAQQDAQQEALLGLIRTIHKCGDKMNAGVAAISVRNHLLHTAERQNAQKRKAVLVHSTGDIHPSAELSPEQLAIAADTEGRIADACESLHRSSSETLALAVVLHTLSRARHQDWIESHPVEWSVWLNAADMSPARAAEITPVEARNLFTSLMGTLKDAA